MNEKTSKAAEVFDRMSRLITDNTSAHFGGACVIVPPDTGYEKPIEFLLLDSSGDPSQFLATVQSRIQIMMREIEERQRMQQGFGPR